MIRFAAFFALATLGFIYSHPPLPESAQPQKSTSQMLKKESARTRVMDIQKKPKMRLRLKRSAFPMLILEQMHKDYSKNKWKTGNERPQILLRDRQSYGRADTASQHLTWNAAGSQEAVRQSAPQIRIVVGDDYY